MGNVWQRGGGTLVPPDQKAGLLSQVKPRQKLSDSHLSPNSSLLSSRSLSRVSHKDAVAEFLLRAASRRVALACIELLFKRNTNNNKQFRGSRMKMNGVMLYFRSELNCYSPMSYLTWVCFAFPNIHGQTLVCPGGRRVYEKYTSDTLGARSQLQPHRRMAANRTQAQPPRCDVSKATAIAIDNEPPGRHEL